MYPARRDVTQTSDDHRYRLGEVLGRGALATVVTLEAADGRFTLTVVDDGPGVPPVDLPRLGERTVRIEPARSIRV